MSFSPGWSESGVPTANPTSKQQFCRDTGKKHPLHHRAGPGEAGPQRAQGEQKRPILQSQARKMSITLWLRTEAANRKLLRPHPDVSVTSPLSGGTSESLPVPQAAPGPRSCCPPRRGTLGQTPCLIRTAPVVSRVVSSALFQVLGGFFLNSGRREAGGAGRGSREPATTSEGPAPAHRQWCSPGGLMRTEQSPSLCLRDADGLEPRDQARHTAWALLGTLRRKQTPRQEPSDLEGAVGKPRSPGRANRALPVVRVLGVERSAPGGHQGPRRKGWSAWAAPSGPVAPLHQQLPRTQNPADDTEQVNSDSYARFKKTVF